MRLASIILALFMRDVGRFTRFPFVIQSNVDINPLLLHRTNLFSERIPSTFMTCVHLNVSLWLFQYMLSSKWIHYLWKSIANSRNDEWGWITDFFHVAAHKTYRKTAYCESFQNVSESENSHIWWNVGIIAKCNIFKLSRFEWSIRFNWIWAHSRRSIVRIV